MAADVEDMVRSSFEAFLRGDLESLGRAMDPAVEWLWFEPGEWDCHGRDTVLARLGERARRQRRRHPRRRRRQRRAGPRRGRRRPARVHGRDPPRRADRAHAGPPRPRRGARGRRPRAPDARRHRDRAHPHRRRGGARGAAARAPRARGRARRAAQPAAHRHRLARARPPGGGEDRRARRRRRGRRRPLRRRRRDAAALGRQRRRPRGARRPAGRRRRHRGRAARSSAAARRWPTRSPSASGPPRGACWSAARARTCGSRRRWGSRDRVRAQLPGATQEDLDNALWCAAHGGRRETAELLLERGGDPRWVGHDDLTAAQAAERSGADDLAAWLG